MPTMPRCQRRIEELKPGLDYLLRLRRLGPRVGESLLTFEMRLAQVAKGRDMVTSACQQSKTLTAMCKSLGITLQNLNSYLRRLGMDKDMLHNMRSAA